MSGMAAVTGVPGDSGLFYAQTREGRVPVEPWNAASNLVFLALVVYWAWRSRLRLRAHPVTVAGLPVLAAGFVAGTLYHGLRNNDLWRILDAGAIAFLALLASLYLWRAVLGSLARAAAAVIGPALVYRAGFELFAGPPHAVAMAGYVFMALLIVTPAVVHCRRHNRAGGTTLLAAAGCFAAALVFRQMDLWAARRGLPMGTHFLWHIGGGAAAFFAMRYVHAVEAMEAGPGGAGRQATTIPLSGERAEERAEGHGTRRGSGAVSAACSWDRLLDP